MTDREINIQDMFTGIVQFDVVNKADYAHLPEAEANFVIVRSAVSALETAAAAQVSGDRSRAVEQKSVLDAAIRRKMKRYSRTARALNFDDPGFRRLFSIPNERNFPLLLASARAFVEEARRFAADFKRLGIPVTLADELEADILAAEEAIGAKAGASTETVGATADVDEQIGSGMTAAKILDSIMHNVYFDDPVKIAQWISARHVKKAPKRKETPAEPEKEEEPTA